jgi:hypothetical protein
MRAFCPFDKGYEVLNPSNELRMSKLAQQATNAI